MTAVEDPESIAPDVQAQNDKEVNEGQVAHVSTDDEKTVGQPQTAYVPENDDEYNVTFKTWIVVGILSWSYGISFWIVPSLSSCQGVVATQLGDVSAQSFYISIYTMTVTIAFMVCGGE